MEPAREKSLCDWWKKLEGCQQLATVGVPVAVIGAGILLYKLITREPSNEKVYAQSQSVYDMISHKYGSMELLHANGRLMDCTEEDLAAMAFLPDVRMLPQIAPDLQTLKSANEVLQTRVYRDSHKGGRLLREMTNLLHTMKKRISELAKLEKFWRRHGAYFKLYSVVQDLANTYKQARLDIYDQDFVKRAVMGVSVGGGNNYPYLSFSEKLKNNTDMLFDRMRSGQQYEGIYALAEPLYHDLKALLATVASLPEYQQDLHRKKKHQLEQERVDAERAKAEAEREKAKAMERQAAAEREKANAMYMQVAADREKARAIDRQTLVQMAQPKPQVNITLNSPAQSEKQSASSDDMKHRNMEIDPDDNSDPWTTSCVSR